MYNRDIKWAVDCGKLTVDPRPEYFNAGYDETSIDLHLDSVRVARVWDIEAYKEKVKARGSHRHAELELGNFEWDAMQTEYMVAVPEEVPDSEEQQKQKVFRRSNEIVVRPFG